MTDNNQKTQPTIHHTSSGSHVVDRKEFGEFLRSKEGQRMIKDMAQALDSARSGAGQQPGKSELKTS